MTMSDMQRLIQKEKDGAIFPYHGVKSGLLGPSYFWVKPQTLINSQKDSGLHQYKNKPFQWKILTWCYAIMKTKTGCSNESLFLILHMGDSGSHSPPHLHSYSLEALSFLK